MFPPSGSYSVDIEAISGTCGSISIACWVVVFSPQIIENFRRSSAEGLSVEFIIIWLLGDIFNVLGAVLQGVLATMIILAIYYTAADIVLLGQFFYYTGFRLRDPRPDKKPDNENAAPSERSPLILNGHANGNSEPTRRPANAADVETRARSRSTFRERLASLDPTHFSPAVPIHSHPEETTDSDTMKPHQPRSWVQAILFNSTAIVLVVLAGVAGYYLSPAPPQEHDKSAASDQADSLHFSLWGQIFGYICAVLYLGSRVPQLLLNYRRKSTEGLNALFFLFACIGNLTYVLSILAFEPICSRHSRGHWRESHCKSGEATSIYGKYILVNLSWLIGSLGTLFLDFAVFVQFWLYRNNNNEGTAGVNGTPNGEARGRDESTR
ncbi:putative vacuolar amino acid transporter [Fulvia fulva]|uniref:Vacuolar amino acid transporter n=1 Tax=Passalora fulva TaxID=5499 RepID=A0A9Q8PAV7_PASFU|nr:putative vacuolar amino acid transporter [Fulvia fulva]KAK4622280.1 putative vacuolar amino acid transporter [Fulvia fulva]KAK4623027.1 putative vacuolar amino acid transporter [Fulvia fulva]UJO19084.1 putative vacuolar amino acid transporter [Fulvia fulva]WPV15785.1 putative vacuolar amino acid transporter [Fulvia fulva]WPV31405.1 putative vacuolar amino acid transporter [Fulvia fulva]